MRRIDVFGIKIDNLTMEKVLGKIGRFLKSGKQHYVVLPYSEFVVRAQKDEEFKKILNEADLCLCEGRGLYFALKFLGMPIKEEVNGVELIYNLSQKSKVLGLAKRSGAGKSQKLFLLGGRKDVVEKVRKKLGESIIGVENGYQDLNSPCHGNGRGKVIEKINKAKPNILIVALGGSTKQEKWIYENLKKMPSVKVAIGVGGAFDFISGRIKRAPKFVQRIGLEWLWRLILQPWRIKRVYNGVVKFGWLVLKEKMG